HASVPIWAKALHISAGHPRLFWTFCPEIRFRPNGRQPCRRSGSRGTMPVATGSVTYTKTIRIGPHLPISFCDALEDIGSPCSGVRNQPVPPASWLCPAFLL